MNEKIIFNILLLKCVLFYFEFLRFCRKNIFFDVIKYKIKCLILYFIFFVGMYVIVKI